MMDYSRMKKAQLIEEMEALQGSIAELARAETERKQAEAVPRRHALRPPGGEAFLQVISKA
jgi:hypothetical protein